MKRKLPERGEFCSDSYALIISLLAPAVHCLLMNFTHHYLGMTGSWHYQQDLIELTDIHSLSMKMRVSPGQSSFLTYVFVQFLDLYICLQLLWPLLPWEELHLKNAVFTCIEGFLIYNTPKVSNYSLKFLLLYDYVKQSSFNAFWSYLWVILWLISK